MKYLKKIKLKDINNDIKDYYKKEKNYYTKIEEKNKEKNS